ncbi:MAG: hypothetical protein AMJ81_14275 [Phycisphaerae bacterium SM23_33]|nr:MAG: hypothetical protein AMJ81_14275 [Phycisphaerae bacterium SM23_33]
MRFLAEEIGPRPPGSKAERRTAEWLAQQFAEMGYEPAIEEFACPAHGAEGASLSGLAQEIQVYPTQHSPVGRVSGALRWLGFGEEHLLKELDGSIGVLMARGSLAERHRLLDRLESAGMRGVIVAGPYANTVTGKAVRSGRLNRLLTATISLRAARRLPNHFGQRVTLEITGDRPEVTGTSQNVLTRLPGSGPHSLVVCSHYDTAACCPGALDNATGIALMLELARRFKGRRPAATLLFVGTGAEEFGAEDYCGRGLAPFFQARLDDLPNFIACFAVDGVGDALGVRQLRVSGPRAFAAAVPTFENVSVGPHYHGPEDTPDIVDFDALADMLPVCSATMDALAECRPFYRYVRKDDLLIRPARWDDIPAICEITRQAFGPFSLARMREDFFGEQVGGKPWHRHKVESVRAAAQGQLDWHIVAEIDGQAVGYASYFLRVRAPDIAEVGNNAVRPEHQGRGIGMAMQQEIMARLEEEGFRRWTVTTLINDIPAQRIYAKMGFQELTRMLIYLRQ